MTIERVPGSYRDPGGHVYFDEDGKIYRTINASRASVYEKMRADSIIEDSVKAGFLVSTDEVSNDDLKQRLGACYLLQHQKIPYISYPYEWTFHQLKAAALHHLKFQLFLLERNYTLSDATAYNIQYNGCKPVFIDVLSITPYKEGDIWVGYQQFLEQFLNPLLLTSMKGIHFNSWYRGSLEGISTDNLLSVLSLKQKLNWRIILFLVLYQKTANKVISDPGNTQIKATATKKRVSKHSLISMLTQFHTWIEKLALKNETTVWSDYADTNTYDSHERKIKSEFISSFVSRNKLKSLIDLGCNTGDYSQAAIQGGAEYVVGFDFDHKALAKAFNRSIKEKIPFLPLWLDASNPSPGQGWMQDERGGFDDRFNADGVVALAFEHHLSIAKNIPLEKVIEWIISIADRGIIEFVPKDDPTIKQMLSTREDIFTDYNEKNFETALSKHAITVNKLTVSKSGRTLYEYKKL